MTVVGRTLVGIGVIVLLFVAYQLWGTGLAESHSQDVLRHQLAGQLRRSLGTAPAPPPTTAGSGAAPPVVASPAPPTAAPPEGRAVGIIRIPRIGLDKAIVEGTDTADLRQGPGHYAGTPLPGQPGNSAVAGHRTTYGAPFSRLDELRSGDQVVVITPQGTFRYNINRSLVVEPSDVSVIAPVNANELTLTTCTPRFSAARRLVVQATLVGVPAPPAAAPTSPRRASSGLAGGTGGWLSVVAWGVAAVALAIGLWLVARTRRRRWLVYLLGTPPFLAVLFMFFVAISKLLPASI
ncbi:MAG: class E sortase [Actinobacteria bacterium]|nr:MAG: class E sortase [Actinomycetota bacterium]